MNVALNMLKPNQMETSALPGKTVNPKTKSAQRTSFSDSLNNAVSQSNKTTQEKNQNTVEQLNAVEIKPLNTSIVPSGVANLVKKNLDSTTDQTGTDLSSILDINTPEADSVETAQSSPDMPIAINNSAIVVQMIIPVQTATDVADAPTESTTASIAAVSVNFSEAPVVSSGQNVQSLATLADNCDVVNSQINQTPDLLPSLHQSSKDQPTTARTENVILTNSPDQADPSSTLFETGIDQQPMQIKNMNAILTNSPDQADTSSTLLTTAVTESVLSKTIASDSMQAVDPNFIPVVSLQDKSSKQQFNSERQNESSTDQNLFTQPQVVQDTSADTVDIFTPHMIVQGMESLLAKSDTLGTTSVTETQQQPNSLTDIHQVVDQIVEQTKIISKPQNTEMIIKLKPEHLGELTLKVVIENGTVKASFHSDNTEVRSIIEASLPQLKQDLANNGLKVENVSVYAGLSQFSPNQDHDRSSRQQIIKLNNKKSSDDFIEAIGSENNSGKVTGLGTQSGVDYRI
ncbi:flagellar hook-length control protein FliK [Sporomusa malonica]|uniref:Hook-length control protein FliK n=1 Tax=Sporomusa malonica TaxID=112901 RepID=A0A1W2AZD1_9FIRM|nr:flagellar hook-length control protein FliK [Sporomusa malonica]SMC65954.1 hook-length control protein FliK [Sporomusa malonica]